MYISDIRQRYPYIKVNICIFIFINVFSYSRQTVQRLHK